VRVDTYTNVHAVAELSDGKLYMVQTFVKASGGCSAPAAKHAEEAKASLGQMRLRQFAAEAPVSRAKREAQIMMRHPNHSGLQRDQITHLYVPAHFVNELRVFQGDRLMLAVEGGISISEDPNIRFSYAPNGAGSFRAEATDTNGLAFKGEWPVETGM
jgi:sulfur-oxidizing protein SoxY